MRWRLLWIGLVVLLTCVLQTSLLPFLRLGPVVSLPLVILTSLIISDQKYPVRWFALFAGLVLDLFSPFPFGLHLISLLVAILVSETLFLNFFTNRSIYAMILLVIAGTITKGLLWLGGAFVMAFLNVKALRPSWTDVSLWQILGNIVCGILVFYILLFFRSLFGRYFFPRQTRL